MITTTPKSTTILPRVKYFQLCDFWNHSNTKYIKNNYSTVCRAVIVNIVLLATLSVLLLWESLHDFWSLRNVQRLFISPYPVLSQFSIALEEDFLLESIFESTVIQLRSHSNGSCPLRALCGRVLAFRVC